MASASSSISTIPVIATVVADPLQQVEVMLGAAVRGKAVYAELVATLMAAHTEIQKCADTKRVAGDLVANLISGLDVMPEELRAAQRVAETVEGTDAYKIALRTQGLLLQQVFSAVTRSLCCRYSILLALQATLLEGKLDMYSLSPFGQANQLTGLEVDATVASLVKPYQEALMAAKGNWKQYCETILAVTGCTKISNDGVQQTIQTLIQHATQPDKFVDGLLKMIFSIEHSKGLLSKKDVRSWVLKFTRAIFFAAATDSGCLDHLQKQCLPDLVTLFRNYGTTTGPTEEQRKRAEEVIHDHADFVLQRRRHELELRWLRIIYNNGRSREAPVVLITGSQRCERANARCGVPKPWMPPGVADDLRRQLIDKRRELGTTRYQLPRPLSDEALIALLEKKESKKKPAAHTRETGKAASGAGAAAAREEVEEATFGVATRVFSAAEKLAQDLINTPRPPMRERVALWVLGDPKAAAAQWLKWYPARRFSEQETIDCHAVPEVFMRLSTMAQYSRELDAPEGESMREVRLTKRVAEGGEERYSLTCCFNSVGYVFHANLLRVGAKGEVVELDDTDASEQVIMPEMERDEGAAAGAGGWSASLPYVVGEDRKGPYINVRGADWYPQKL